MHDYWDEEGGWHWEALTGLLLHDLWRMIASFELRNTGEIDGILSGGTNSGNFTLKFAINITRKEENQEQDVSLRRIQGPSENKDVHLAS